MRSRMLFAVLAVLAVSSVQPAFALLISGSSTSAPHTWSSQALLNVATVGATHYLELTLTNLASYKSASPSNQSEDQHTLTGLFFTLPSGWGLNWSSANTNNQAQIAAGSDAYDGSTGTGTFVAQSPTYANYPNLDGEWAWRDDLAFANVPGATVFGVSTAGLGLFGPPDKFVPYSGPALDGADYGLVSAGTVPGDGLLNSNLNPVVIDSAFFRWTLTGVSNPDALAVAHYRFQYGTNLTTHWDDDPGDPGDPYGGPGSPVPEPASMALLALAVGGVGAVLKRRRQ